VQILDREYESAFRGHADDEARHGAKRELQLPLGREAEWFVLVAARDLEQVGEQRPCCGRVESVLCEQPIERAGEGP